MTSRRRFLQDVTLASVLSAGRAWAQRPFFSSMAAAPTPPESGRWTFRGGSVAALVVASPSRGARYGQYVEPGGEAVTYAQPWGYVNYPSLTVDSVGTLYVAWQQDVRPDCAGGAERAGGGVLRTGVL